MPPFVFKFVFAFLSLCLIAPGLSAARAEQAPPLPARKQDALRQIDAKIETARKQKESAEKESLTAKRNIDETQGLLVETASGIRRNEKSLAALELRISEMSARKREIEKSLEKNYGATGDLILALERMGRVPPQAMIARPGSPLETAQTSILLRSALPVIQRQAARLSADIAELASIEQKLARDRSDALKTRQELSAQESKLNALLAEKQSQYDALRGEAQSAEVTIARLQKESADLQELIRKLAEEQEKQAALEKEREKERQRRTAGMRDGKPERPRPAERSLWPRLSLPGLGRAQSPVSGKIVTRFGETDDIGAVSQGLKFEVEPRALAIAPMDGIVQFANTFKNYGTIVIIEHKNGYHSLIAGMDEITTRVGQPVRAGEPIGRLPKASSRSGKPTLYYELRHKGKTIDPARQLSDLES